MTEQDYIYMRRAIQLARQGQGWCHPNPMVGAVIVRDGRIIGEGYHQKCGELHAERNAFASLTECAQDATLYVTLEPCCHYGKTPPCTEAIIQHGIARVVVGSRDPNPRVNGGGVRILREAGIQVDTDFLREECDALNPVFFHYIQKHTPYVIQKYAMTLDGKIATQTGASKWITGPASRAEVQSLRHACMAIMVGIGTVLADDPLLTCRIPGGRNPIRIIADSHLRIPLDSQLVATAHEVPTYVVTAFPEQPAQPTATEHPAVPAQPTATEHPAAPAQPTDRSVYISPETESKVDQLQALGVRLLNLPSADGPGVDLKKLMQVLGEMEVDSLLLEGGGTLNESALRAGIVNEIQVYVAPKIFGGRAKSPVEGQGVNLPEEAYRFQIVGIDPVGEDIRLRCLPRTE